MKLEITHPDKILFPDDKITKREFVAYYQRIGPVMLPYMKGRPVSMQRFPDGIGSQGFFQKEAPESHPEWVKVVALKKEGGAVHHVVCDNADTLVYLANQNCITPHAGLSRVDKPYNPDQMIFDLDPSKDDFRAVCAAAQALKELLAERKLPALVKTTGSRGLHVMVPLDRRAGFDAVRTLAREIALELVSRDPGHLTMETRKTNRAGKIFVDIARNAYGQTAAPAYAVRARKRAPVSTPLEWSELDQRDLRSDSYTIRNIFARLEARGDPWKQERRAKTRHITSSP